MLLLLLLLPPPPPSPPPPPPRHRPHSRRHHHHHHHPPPTTTHHRPLLRRYGYVVKDRPQRRRRLLRLLLVLLLALADACLRPSSFLGLPYRILNINPQKELLWSLRVIGEGDSDLAHETSMVVGSPNFASWGKGGGGARPATMSAKSWFLSCSTVNITWTATRNSVQFGISAGLASWMRGSNTLTKMPPKFNLKVICTQHIPSRET